MSRLAIIILATLLVTACGPRELQPDTDFECSNCERWNTPHDPFRVLGNTWYVGTDGLSAILIETTAGPVLIDGGLPQSAAQIEENIREVGFEARDLAAILLSHAHFDHAGGIAALQRLSGAPVYASIAGAVVLESGELQPDDPQFLHGVENTRFPAVKNVIALMDGETLSIGGVDITPVYTPGHTPGGTSWTWESCALGSCYDIVYADSLTAVAAPGYRYSDGPAVQQMIDSAGKIADLDCDILLSPHPFFFGMHDKLEKQDDGNPFINNVACMIYAETSLDWLEQRLQSEGH